MILGIICGFFGALLVEFVALCILTAIKKKKEKNKHINHTSLKKGG